MSRNISYSALSTYLQCPYKYKRVYIDRVPADSIYLRVGKAVHSYLDMFMNNKVCLGEIKSFLYQELVSKPMNEVGNTYSEVELMSHYKLAVSILNSQAVLEIFFNLISCIKDIRNIETEQHIEFTHDNINYKGFIDVVVESKDDITIIDYKTSKNMYYVDWLQFEFYVFLYSFWLKNIEKRGIPDKYICKIWFIRYNKYKYREIYKKEIAQIYYKISNIAKKMLSDNSFKYTENKFCNWCPFKKECLFHENFI